MTVNFDGLRIAVGLTHYVPGASLTIYRKQGRPLVVEAGENGDLDPCRMRQLIAAHMCPTLKGRINNVVHYELGGTLESYGGDLFRVADTNGVGEQRWFATLLCPASVSEILERTECDHAVTAQLETTINVDPALGVTAICIASDDVAITGELQEATQRAYAACLVDELIYDATGVSDAHNQNPTTAKESEE